MFIAPRPLLIPSRTRGFQPDPLKLRRNAIGGPSKTPFSIVKEDEQTVVHPIQKTYAEGGVRFHA